MVSGFESFGHKQIIFPPLYPNGDGEKISRVGYHQEWSSDACVAQARLNSKEAQKLLEWEPQLTWMFLGSLTQSHGRRHRKWCEKVHYSLPVHS